MVTRRCVSLLLLIPTLATGPAACAAKRPSPHTPAQVALPVGSRLMVMRPILAAGANTGNTGRDFDAISAELTGRLLSIVRERFADAEVATPGLVAGPPLPGYRAAAREGIGGDELNVAIRAAAGGATHLLVPTIVEWKEMRTDDPIGAFVLPHNSVTIRFRLMRLQPPALVAAATFHHQARLTLNTKAARLVDEGFRRTLLQVLGAL